MSIETYFRISHQVGDLIGEKDRLNSEILDLAITNFEASSTILKEQNILFFYDWMRFSLYQSWGKLIIRDTPSYETFHSNFSCEIKNLSDFRFIIYINRDVRESDDRIFKIFTIAHELRHVLQYLDSIASFFQTFIIQGYFGIGKRMTNEIYRTIPTEVDAFRKAKAIAIKSFGKEQVNLFIEKEIQASKDEYGRSYWMNIEELDIEKEYNWIKEMRIFWDKYKNEIFSKKYELRQKGTDLEIEEKNFLEAIDLYFKKKNSFRGFN